uniref:non-specific serine/threonine protein kinase n=1 Tax=Fagus sylvatica TaxID=28930 RepID=A0A2N9FNU1_FAGSY
MVPPLPKIGGHGITFFISPMKNFSNSIEFPLLGLFNFATSGKSSNHILAIEMDAVQNRDVGDIDNNHVGIDLNSLQSIEAATAKYFSNKDGKNISLELLSGNLMHLWIDYDEAEKLLNVQLEVITIFLGWSFNKSGQAQSLDVSKLPLLPQKGKTKVKTGLMIMISLIAVTLVLITIGGAAYILRRKKFEEIREDWEREYGPHRFTYKNLYKATKGFSNTELLGAGGFGKVYRGILPSSNILIAVKKVSHDSKQGMKEFVAEIISIGRLRHRNLVQLLGYCRRKGELLLVYDYMPNGSLDKFLYKNEKLNLNWFQRFRIIRGVASSLLYLHEEWEQVVLHRDVKASNVLLDAELNGRLGDFGLAKLYDHDTNPETTHLVGTVGYLAPELTRTGRATTCTDVYAFGAFMLEVACGRRPIELQGLPETEILVDCVFECWRKGAILDVCDPRLEGNYVKEEMELVLKLGLFCSHSMPAARPSMRQVMQFLDGDADLPELPNDNACFGPTNEAPEYLLSFPSSSSKGATPSMFSTDSILRTGR